MSFLALSLDSSCCSMQAIDSLSLPRKEIREMRENKQLSKIRFLKIIHEKNYLKKAVNLEQEKIFINNKTFFIIFIS